jgi:hypothetical protein
MSSLKGPAETRATVPPDVSGSGHLLDNLLDYELFWRDSYSWLKESGYLLRPRYSPGWTPPWKRDNPLKKAVSDFEESSLPLVRASAVSVKMFLTMYLQTAAVMDATRISDGSYVALKRSERLDASVASYVSLEVPILDKLSSEPLAADPQNHCIRHIEILHVPGQIEQNIDLIVLPLLVLWNRYPFSTIGEVVGFFTQVFEVGTSMLFLPRNWADQSCTGVEVFA